MQSIETSNSDGEVYVSLKVPNVLKEENHDFHRMRSIGLGNIYTGLREDELLGSDTSSSPPRICTDTFSSQNSSRYRKASSDLDGEDHEILNILKEMLEGSKECGSVIPEFKKKSEVKKDPTFGLTSVKNSLC